MRSICALFPSPTALAQPAGKTHFTEYRSEFSDVQMASALYPEGTQIASVQLSGSEATLQLSGRMQGGTAKGSVRLVKEDGAWKVSKEDWQIQISMGTDAGPAVAQEEQLPPNAVRPADYASLLGRWQGGEGGASDWTLTFGDGYAVSGQHASGAYYRGEAAIFWELGATSNGIRVPPGWGVLDVQVAEASEPRHGGQVSLGTFSKQGDTLKWCGSEPGSHVRTPSFEAPPSGVRCLTLVRVGEAEGAPVPSVQAAAAAPRCCSRSPKVGRCSRLRRAARSRSPRPTPGSRTACSKAAFPAAPCIPRA